MFEENKKKSRMNLILIFFQVVSVLSTVQRRREIREGMMISWLNMKRFPNRILNVRPFESYSTTTKQKCGSLCLNTPFCKSLNMKQEGHAQYRCDLLDKNMFEENCKFEWDQMTSHYALTVCSCK